MFHYSTYLPGSWQIPSQSACQWCYFFSSRILPRCWFQWFFMFTPILGILPLKMAETESYFSGTCFLNRTFVSRWWFQIRFFMFTPILGILPLKMVETESYFSGTCFLNRTFVSRWWFKYVFLMFTPILGILPLKMVETESYFSGTCFLNRTFVSRWWFQMCFFNVHPDPWGMIQFEEHFLGG